MEQTFPDTHYFGEVHLRLKFSRPPTHLLSPIHEKELDLESPGGLDDDEDEDLRDKEPNELVINCVAAYQLLAGSYFIPVESFKKANYTTKTLTHSNMHHFH